LTGPKPSNAAHQEEGSQQKRETVPVEPQRAEHHDRDLRELHQANQKRFLQLVGDLTGGRGKEKNGRMNNA